MVVGYLYKLREMHAWFARRSLADAGTHSPATQAEPLGGRNVMAYGRDAAGGAFIRANRIGRDEGRCNAACHEQI